jgi:hypothetical protein
MSTTLTPPFTVGDKVQMTYAQSGKPARGFEVGLDKGTVASIRKIKDHWRSAPSMPADATHEIWVRSTRIYFPHDSQIHLEKI